MISTLIALVIMVGDCSHSNKYVGRLSDSEISEAIKIAGLTGGSRDWETLIWAESTNDTEKRNPKSSAYGLLGFLDKTWAGTGYKKTSCGICQLKAGAIYVKKRYGTISRALNFHSKNGYY